MKELYLKVLNSKISFEDFESEIEELKLESHNKGYDDAYSFGYMNGKTDGFNEAIINLEINHEHI